MKYYILILTDNNRNTLNVSMLNENEIYGVVGRQRLIYQEIHESLGAAKSRLQELQGYTRMQKERIIRRSNPNWVNLMRPSLKNAYHPGVKIHLNYNNGDFIYPI